MVEPQLEFIVIELSHLLMVSHRRRELVLYSFNTSLTKLSTLQKLQEHDRYKGAVAGSGRLLS